MNGGTAAIKIATSLCILHGFVKQIWLCVSIECLITHFNAWLNSILSHSNDVNNVAIVAGTVGDEVSYGDSMRTSATNREQGLWPRERQGENK